MARYCNTCGQLLADGSRYCPRCGRVVPAEAFDKAELSEASRFGYARGGTEAYRASPRRNGKEAAERKGLFSRWRDRKKAEGGDPLMSSVDGVELTNTPLVQQGGTPVRGQTIVEKRPDDSLNSGLKDEPIADNSRTTVKRMVRPYLLRRRNNERIYFECPAVLGRGSASTHLIAGNPGISRRHIRIVEDGRGFTVENLSETNGTWIGCEQVMVGESRRIENGAILTLADEEFTFCVE